MAKLQIVFSFSPRNLGKISNLTSIFFHMGLVKNHQQNARLFAEPFYRLAHGEADDLPGLVVDRCLGSDLTNFSSVWDSENHRLFQVHHRSLTVCPPCLKAGWRFQDDPFPKMGRANFLGGELGLLFYPYFVSGELGMHPYKLKSGNTLEPRKNPHQGTWRIIPFSKWLVTPIYKPFRPFGRGITPFRGLTNHGY